jgi:hypothetical protein
MRKAGQQARPFDCLPIISIRFIVFAPFLAAPHHRLLCRVVGIKVSASSYLRQSALHTHCVLQAIGSFDGGFCPYISSACATHGAAQQASVTKATLSHLIASSHVCAAIIAARTS